jgi:uncharacterized protein YndB with AHSA1/START domain
MYDVPYEKPSRHAEKASILIERKEVVMKEQSYQSSFTAPVSPKEAMEKISCVPEWWGKDFEGKSQKLNDVFTVRFPNGDRYQAKVVEIQPESKITWEFIDAYQGWVKDQAEWVGTKILWEVTPQQEGVEVKMTHAGLVPELECFETCSHGWQYLMHESLSKLLNEGKGHPV